MSSLHKRIAQARTARRLSQANFAECLGVTRSASSHWGTGRAKPSTKHIEKIAKLLGIDINWLVGEVKTKEEGFAGESSANLVFEHRTDYPEPYDKETRQVARDYFSLSRGHRKLVRDLIKALNA